MDLSDYAEFIERRYNDFVDYYAKREKKPIWSLERGASGGEIRKAIFELVTYWLQHDLLEELTDSSKSLEESTNRLKWATYILLVVTIILLTIEFLRGLYVIV